jgi:DNA-binding Lrp family transcriptional regulator
MDLDDLDRSLLRLLVEEPRAGSREYARVLGVARGTVLSRIARLERGRAVSGYAAHLSPSAIGFPVLAFIHLHLTQGRLDDVAARLADLPEVLEAHSMTGEGDMLCRVVTRDHAHLEHVVQHLLAIPGVVRTQTEIALRERVPYRILPLLQHDH